MKIKNEYILYSYMGENLVRYVGEKEKFQYSLISLNETAAFIFRSLQNDICEEALLLRIQNEYDVELQQARKDLNFILQQFEDMGFLNN